MEDFVTYEQAVKLKKFGFDWDCGYYYDEITQKFKPNTNDSYCELSTNDLLWNNNKMWRCTSAPTLSQVQKWFREVKGIIICIEPRFYRNKRPLMGYDYRLFNKDDGCYSNIKAETIYDTYEQAVLAALNKILELLKI